MVNLLAFCKYGMDMTCTFCEASVKQFYVTAQVGSMTFFWALPTHLDEADSRSWLKGPKNRTSPQIFRAPNSLRVMVTRHPFERLASLYNYMQQGLPVSNLTGGEKNLQTLTKCCISASFQNKTTVGSKYPPIDGVVGRIQSIRFIPTNQSVTFVKIWTRANIRIYSFKFLTRMNI